MLVQHFINVFRLSFLLITACSFNPTLVVTVAGQAGCSLAMGGYVTGRAWLEGKGVESSLQYVPNESNQELFTQLTQECGIDPETITVKYAYTGGCIAMALHNTMIVDPVVWSGLEDDEQAEAVKASFAKDYEPALTEMQKQRIAGIAAHMAPSVQRFIFKHELGHCSRNYSYYKLFLTFCIATLATFAGILVTRKIMRRIASVFGWGGFLALLLGVLVAGSCDLILTFASNATWKLHEETMADHFAAHYSSYEDIVEAADFFAKHQAIFDESKNSWNWLEYLPSEIKTGHPSGESRSSYLLQLAAKKN